MQAFIDLGELLISSDTGAALDAFKTVSPSLFCTQFWIVNLTCTSLES